MDQILYWNEIALDANRDVHTAPLDDRDAMARGPAHSARALGIIHLAMHDAYFGIAGGGPLYDQTPNVYPPPPANSPATVDAAIAAAAHATLSALYPSMKATFDRKHRQAGLTGTQAQQAEGNKYGLAVASKRLDDRKNDPSGSDNGYSGPTAHSDHRPDPDNSGQGYYAPFYGQKSKRFASAHFDLAKPPRPGHASYLPALKQVRAKGIAPELSGSIPEAKQRKADETIIGLYWGYDGAAKLGTPPRLYNKIVRQVAMAKGNTLAQNARLFALINVAMADAGILCWEQKYIHTLWRPVLGVREHDDSMGPSGVAGSPVSNEGDPTWLPLGAPRSNELGKNFTPPFPAYPSGHATFGAACFHMTRLFYGVPAGNRAADTTVLGPGFSFVSSELDGETTDNRGTVRPRHVRKFPGGLWQMIVENGLSRVYLGVHWHFDAFATKNDDGVTPDLTENIGGVPLGLNIAESIFAGGLKKV